MIKVGINGKDIQPKIYVRQRYGPGTEILAGFKFDVSLRELEKKVEQPILQVLKTRGDICEIVCSKKEHFWVKDKDVPKFVKVVIKLLSSRC